MARKINGGAEIVARMVKSARERRERALQLRNSGMTIQQVGDRMGISKQRAAELISRAKRENAEPNPA